ncbi:MFS transporter [Methylobacterium sp. Leaf94]|uniref:MFS transporter n=1 Tax=unclassified Methylobacterium TaxID=2615210 RepID=UPI0006F8DA62|nr:MULTISPECIES: MFS transporter [unclassified Methylobacterium]KQO73166.1 MFS transporter [Methylobacterium sp. Leaf89]KQU24438.1 MFS transporter [Methylobacterium sp. Leaf94]
MDAETLSRRTLRFVNVAHALDHFVLLIYPTAVIAIAAQTGRSYGELIPLATGAFVAFGLCALPMGWLADRFGRRTLLAIFFFGYGLSCLGVASAGSPTAFLVWLCMLGLASAIYHPVGSTMLVSHARRLGRDLGVNGVWGNLGAATASGVTALLATAFGWQAAFVVPGLVCLACGTAFLALVPGDGAGSQGRAGGKPVLPVARPIPLLCVFAFAVVAGGMTFNITTIALPKVVDERVGNGLPLFLIGSVATLVFAFGALTQLLMGRLIDRYSLPVLFLGLSILQPLGLGLAAASTGVPLLAGLVLTMAALYGQVVINDAMVARYVPPLYRARAYSVRYFLGFTVSGFVVPLIGLLHDRGGFGLVLGIAAAFGAVIAAAALGFFVLTRQPASPAVAPAA